MKDSHLVILVFSLALAYALASGRDNLVPMFVGGLLQAGTAVMK